MTNVIIDSNTFLCWSTCVSTGQSLDNHKVHQLVKHSGWTHNSNSDHCSAVWSACPAWSVGGQARLSLGGQAISCTQPPLSCLLWAAVVWSVSGQRWPVGCGHSRVIDGFESSAHITECFHQWWRFLMGRFWADPCLWSHYRCHEWSTLPHNNRALLTSGLISPTQIVICYLSVSLLTLLTTAVIILLQFTKLSQIKWHSLAVVISFTSNHYNHFWWG